MEQAKKEIYNLLLHTASTRYGFNTIVKYISQKHKISYVDLKNWIDEQRNIITKEVEDLVYHKV